MDPRAGVHTLTLSQFLTPMRAEVRSRLAPRVVRAWMTSTFGELQAFSGTHPDYGQIASLHTLTLSQLLTPIRARFGLRWPACSPCWDHTHNRRITGLFGCAHTDHGRIAGIHTLTVSQFLTPIRAEVRSRPAPRVVRAGITFTFG